MDDVERLILAFNARGATRSPAAKLNVLLDLERLHDGRVVSFLLQVLADPGEPSEVRASTLRRLRNGPLTAEERSSVALAFSELVLRSTSDDLRLQAAVALGEFIEISGVPRALGSLALQPNAFIDLRYCAFTSLERAGPTPECVNLLRQMANDEIMGSLAKSALDRWRIEPTIERRTRVHRSEQP
jgi:hypothetical protein